MRKHTSDSLGATERGRLHKIWGTREVGANRFAFRLERPSGSRIFVGGQSIPSILPWFERIEYESSANSKLPPNLSPEVVAGANLRVARIPLPFGPLIE